MGNRGAAEEIIDALPLVDLLADQIAVRIDQRQGGRKERRQLPVPDAGILPQVDGGIRCAAGGDCFHIVQQRRAALYDLAAQAELGELAVHGGGEHDDPGAGDDHSNLYHHRQAGPRRQQVVAHRHIDGQPHVQKTKIEPNPEAEHVYRATLPAFARAAEVQAGLGRLLREMETK